jgi:hypothetical protein
MKFDDPQGHFGFRNIDRPECLTQYYAYSNVVDARNELRQSELALEEKWGTTNAYIRLVTTLIGSNVVDSMHMCKKCKMVPQNMTTMLYANVLAKQLLDLAMEKKELDLMHSFMLEQWPHLPAELGKLVNSQGKCLKNLTTLFLYPVSLVERKTVSILIRSVPCLSHTNFVLGEMRRDKNGRLHELCITEPMGSGRKEPTECLQQGSSTKKGLKEAKSFRLAKPCQRGDCHYLSRFYCHECNNIIVHHMIRLRGSASIGMLKPCQKIRIANGLGLVVHCVKMIGWATAVSANVVVIGRYGGWLYWWFISTFF